MSLEIPNSRNVFLPQLPDSLEDKTVLKDYLWKMSTEMEKMYTQMFDNVDAVRNAVNTGTSGTFLASGGATITIVNGVITGLA